MVLLGKVWLCKDTHVLFSASDEGGNGEEDTSDDSSDDNDDDGGNSGEEDTGDSDEDLSTSGCDQLIGLVPDRRKLANNVSLNLSLKYPTYKQGWPWILTVIDYLELVWPASLVDLVASETNRYALEKGGYWIRPFMTFFDYAVNNAFIFYKHNC